jgi:hypothetical protein
MRLLVFAAATLVSLIPTGCTDKPSIQPVAQCDNPAPLRGQLDPRAPEYLITFHDSVNAAAETDRLARVYEITPAFVYTSIPAFAASLSDEVREELRCEPSVQYVDYGAIVGIDR